MSLLAHIAKFWLLILSHTLFYVQCWLVSIPARRIPSALFWSCHFYWYVANFHQLKIAYRPGEKFSPRDFHHAVKILPLDGFLPEQHGSVPTGDVSLTNLFSNRVIYSWATDDISKKVIAICMSAQTTEALRRSLMDAAEQCIAEQFVMLETDAGMLHSCMMLWTRIGADPISVGLGRVKMEVHKLQNFRQEHKLMIRNNKSCSHTTIHVIGTFRIWVRVCIQRRVCVWVGLVDALFKRASHL